MTCVKAPLHSKMCFLMFTSSKRSDQDDSDLYLKGETLQLVCKRYNCCITVVFDLLGLSLSKRFFSLCCPSSFLPPALPPFFFISHWSCVCVWRWRVCCSCPPWQADSSRPDVEPGPAEQIMLTQLSRGRQRQAELSGLQSGALSSFFPAMLRSTPHQN